MPELKLISSMATSKLLTELAVEWQRLTANAASITSIGGVDAAKRVASGEAFDVVILASDAIDRLDAGGCLRSGQRRDFVASSVAIAVQSGTARPAVMTEQALRETVLAAASVGYSTGPSGKALLDLFRRWDVLESLSARLVQAPPGVPVGSMLAEGTVALGFQQYSELKGLLNVDILGMMPAGCEIDTVFSGSVCKASSFPEAAAEFLAFLCSPQVAGAKERHGLRAI